jgi:dipeptidyl-peptidase-4
MARDGSSFIDTFSTPETPPQSTLRDAEGREITTLIPNALAPGHPYWPYAEEHAPTEFGTLTAEDGQTLYWSMLKPRHLVPGRRYPVIIDLYGGPTQQYVTRSWNDPFRQYLVQRGFVVFSLDNRGSGARGRRFDSVLYRRMGSVEVKDQVAGVEYLRTLPFVDPARIGVLGWSYGGYLALMCMMTAPDQFAAGVAGAPVTDWTLYDTHYTERYLGTPQDDAAGYAESGVLKHAAGLRGPLLVMHGMADDNVLFTHSTVLFRELQRLSKPFDAMTYPGGKHGLLRHPDMGPHAYAMIERFFAAHLAPREGASN